MNDINNFLFELIQVAIGTRICLSHTPGVDEWGELYSMAKKQSLVGVCFAGVQKLVNQRQEPPEMLYLTWMGMAAKIQQRNEVVNRQCVELQERLAKDGFRSCIMKGQSNNPYYGELAMLRQSGDIDVWMCDDMESVLKYVNETAPTDDVNEIHVHYHIFEDTEVELHFIPILLANKVANIKLQKWLNANKETQFCNSITLSNGQRLISPTIEFNMVYQLLHIYRHLFSEGIGLRQLMDYYFVLQSCLKLENADEIKERIKTTIRVLGLGDFVSALMWVMQKVFGLESNVLPWVPNQEMGEFLLEEILQMGNFGHADNRFKLDKNDSHLSRFFQMCRSKLRFVGYFPSEVMWQPVEILTRFFEIRRIRRINNRIRKQQR